MKMHTRTILSAGAILLFASVLHAQFSAPLTLPGDTALAPPTGDQTNLAFARGASATLMVWEDTRAAVPGTQDSHGYDGLTTRIKDVYAARIDDAGNMLDTPPIVVTRVAFSQTVPKVAWNGQNWLVVWTSRTAGPSFSTQGVYGTRISATGQILDDPPIVINDTLGFDEREPVVASDGNMWAVIWFANLASTDGVRGCLVSAAGTPDAPRTFFQSTGGVNYYVPFNFQLAWAGGRYLLVYEHMNPNRFDDDIFGQLFDASLTKVGGESSVSTNTWSQNHAAIASNGAGFFVTWYDDRLPPQVRGSPVSANGVVTVPDGAVFESPPSDTYMAAGWDGVNWIAAWRDYGGAMSYPIHAARVSGAGAMLPGSPFTVSAGNWSMERPAIGTLGNGVLVGWSDLRNVHFFFSNSPPGADTTDLYGAFVDVTGNVSPDQSLLFSPPAQTRPDLAGNAASGYLVTFLSETAGTGSVMAQRVNALGVPIDPQPIVVATGTRLIRNPAVAFDGMRWLVTWEELLLNGSTGWGNVFARRVGTNGIPIDAAPILVMAGNTPDVAAVGGVFLVVSTTNPSEFQSIHGARVRGSDGAVLDATPIFIGSYFSVDPAVTAFADRWLVAWQQYPSHDAGNPDIRASFVLASGAPVGQVVVTPGGRAPSVTAGGSTAIVSWNSYSSDIRARRIQSDGTLLDTSAGFVVSNAFNKQFSPESGWDGGRWFVAWNDYRAHTNVLDGGVGDVYGSRVEADGTVSDAAGLAVANDFRVPETNPTVAGDLGIAISAYAAFRDASPFGNFRITLEGLNGSNGIASYCFGDGTLATACPCVPPNTVPNPPAAPGHGCANSQNLDGALLSATGTTGPDTVTFSGFVSPVYVGFGMLLKGDAQAPGGIASDDGVRCVDGQVIRFGAHYAATNGAPQGYWTYPNTVQTTPVSVQTAQPPAQTAYYQFFYRNPAANFCTAATTNWSNGIQIDWL